MYEQPSSDKNNACSLLRLRRGRGSAQEDIKGVRIGQSRERERGSHPGAREGASQEPEGASQPGGEESVPIVVILIRAIASPGDHLGSPRLAAVAPRESPATGAPGRRDHPAARSRLGSQPSWSSAPLSSDLKAE